MSTELTLKEQLEILDMFLNENGLCNSLEEYLEKRGYSYSEFTGLEQD